MSNKDEEDLESQLRWINLRADLDAMEEEPTLEKMKRKFASNPLIPIGKMQNIFKFSLTN